MRMRIQAGRFWRAATAFFVYTYIKDILRLANHTEKRMICVRVLENWIGRGKEDRDERGDLNV